MIKKYSSSYTNFKDNFVIIQEKQNEVPQKFKESPVYGVFCVVQNIIQRGEPSRPSDLIRSLIGEMEEEEIRYLINDSKTYWGKTIKGDAGSMNYPALKYFDELLPKYLDDYGYVRNLIVPEARFEEIIGYETVFAEQQVDFYIPSLSLVIEIDGSTHDDYLQKQKDKDRDNELKRYGIEIMRIKTSDIYDETQVLKTHMGILIKKVRENKELQLYKECLNAKQSDVSVKLEAIMRLQICLLSCLMEQRLSLDKETWTIVLSSDDISALRECMTIAYNDLQLWMKSIFTLLKIEVSFPSIRFSHDKKKSDLNIDLEIFKRYDDTCDPEPKDIIIRTDYYPNKNYYKVATSETLNYKLDLEEPSQDKRSMVFLLKNIFGFDSFQEGQIPVLANVMSGRDTVGILPTGAGKSLCYQFVTMLQPGITLIIDPIVSLMQDQKRTMREIGISHNDMVSSSQNSEAKKRIQNQFKEGKLQMLWISPERFQDIAFREYLAEVNRTQNFCLAVIDEVHCLSEWGHDFRISYLTLVKTLRAYCPAAIIVGLTATASEFVLKDIRVVFGDDEPLSLNDVKTMESMDRKELIFERIEVESDFDRKKQIENIVERYMKNAEPSSGLLFCPTVRGKNGCDDMSVLLNKHWADKYRIFNGQMLQKEKEKNQEEFMAGEFPLMVCTKAFGMGVDKQNLRYTIHNSLPSSVESFYQEAGRAGRDRKESHCYIIYKVNDWDRSEMEKLSAGKRLLDVVMWGDNYNFNNSDLGTTFYFLKNNHMKEIEEKKYVSRVLLSLKDQQILRFNENVDDMKKQKLENALYKLSLLGFVKDWTVKYNSLTNGFLIVDAISYDKTSTDEVLKKFIDYVHKYDVEFSLESAGGVQYKRLLEQDDKKVRSSIIQMLIRWTNNNILYQRIQCAKTMMDWCHNSVSDDEFRLNLEGYFRFTYETNVLEYIAYHPTEWQKWFDVLYDLNEKKTKMITVISRESARKNYASLQRFIESYQNNTGLNYIDGLLQLYIKDDVTEEDLMRMKRSLTVIKELDEKKQDEILKRTMLFAQHFDIVQKKDLLSKVLLDYFPGKSKMIFEGLNDRYSLSIELGKMVSRMESIKWII